MGVRVSTGRYRRAVKASVGWLEPVRSRGDPYLDETQRAVLQIVLRVPDAGTRSHVLHRTAAKRLARPRGVGVRELTLDDVRDDLHIAMWMRAKAAVALDEVVVHDAQHTWVRVEGESAGSKLRSRDGAGLGLGSGAGAGGGTRRTACSSGCGTLRTKSGSAT